MKHTAKVVIATATLVTGCMSIPFDENIQTGKSTFSNAASIPTGPIQVAVATGKTEKMTRGLVRAATEAGVTGVPPTQASQEAQTILQLDERGKQKIGQPMNVAGRTTNSPLLPPELANLTLTKKLISASLDASFPNRSGNPKLELNASDVKDFVRTSSTLFGVGDRPGSGGPIFAAVPTESQNYDAKDLFEAYLVAYYDGKFVTRAGVELSKPSFKGGVSNDTIKALMTVILEALYDAKFAMPVFYEGSGEKRKWITPGGKAPTAVVLNEQLGEPISEKGVTKNEAQALYILSSLAGDQSTLLSGMLVRAFGDVHFTVVLGANFSIGNDLLPIGRTS